MSDGSASVEPDPAQDKVILLYDYSKHLLSLALLGLGGVLSLAQSPLGRTIPAPVVALLVAVLAVSGFLSLSCTASILRARQQDQPVGRGAWLASRFAMMFLGIAIGAFLVAWIDTLL